MTRTEKAAHIESLKAQRERAEARGDSRRVAFLTRSINRFGNRPTSD